MTASRLKPSAPFASRELNGEVLLSELEELRAAQVPQRALTDCALAARELRQAPPADAARSLGELARSRFAGQPALATLLGRWARRLRVEADVPALVTHLEQLALTSAMVPALRRAAERLPRGGQS
jgi:hypothetical protein